MAKAKEFDIKIIQIFFKKKTLIDWFSKYSSDYSFFSIRFQG